MTLQELKTAAITAASNFNELNIAAGEIIKILKKAGISAGFDTKVYDKGSKISAKTKERRLVIEIGGKTYNENAKNGIFIARFLSENL